MTWAVAYIDAQVQSYIEALPKDIQAPFSHIVRLIRDYGPERMHAKHVKHIEGPIWEMRMKGRDKIARAFYVTTSGNGS